MLTSSKCYMRTSKTVAGRRPQHKCRVISSEFCISETEVQACISVGLLHSKGAVQLNNCQNESFWLPTRKVADKPAKQKTKEDLSVTLPLQMKCSAVPGCSGDQEESVHVWLLPAKANTTKKLLVFSLDESVLLFPAVHQTKVAQVQKRIPTGFHRTFINLDLLMFADILTERQSTGERCKCWGDENLIKLWVKLWVKLKRSGQSC